MLVNSLVKRQIDIFVSLVAIVVLICPGFLLLILVRIRVGSPIFFIQTRTGLNGKPFRLIKFRSMSEEFNKEGQILPDSERLTSFGKFLRSTSLDELPSLWNVLIGDMSLVGPRPLLVDYLPLYSKVQARRHEVRPGITGWAQVNGRNSISWDKKFKLDVWYVDNNSILLDLKI